MYNKIILLTSTAPLIRLGLYVLLYLVADGPFGDDCLPKSHAEQKSWASLLYPLVNYKSIHQIKSYKS